MSPAEEDSDDGDRYSFKYSSGELNQPTAAIIEAVSWVEDVDTAALDPLAEVIDPDALNELFGRRAGRQLFRRSASEPTPEDLEVAFEYAGYVVTVESELIRVRPQ